MVAGWHRGLFSSSVPLDYYAGGYRQRDPGRPCLQTNVGVQGAGGAPFETVLKRIDGLFEIVRVRLAALDLRWPLLSHRDRAKHLATVVGVAVGGLVQIHPFVNGNGRTSRLLWEALLYRFGLPPQVAVVRRPGPPYEAVMAAAMKGDFGPAVALVLTAISLSRPPPQQLPLV